MQRDRTNKKVLVGTSREDRLLKALLPAYVCIDERSLTDWLVILRRLSEHIQYYNDKNQPSGNWSPFLSNNITVLLAEIIAVDLQQRDTQFLTKIYQTRQLSQIEDKAKSFLELFQQFHSTIQMINSWYNQFRSIRKWEEPLRIETNLKSTIEDHFAPVFSNLCHEIEDAKKEGLESLKLEPTPLFDELNDIWGPYYKYPYRPKKKKAGTKVQQVLDWDEQDKRYDRLIGQLRKAYKKFHGSLAYIQQLAKVTFRDTIENQSNHQPHLGLLLSFLKMYGHANDHLNTLTGRHLDYYFREVLQLNENGGIPDHTIVCFQPAQQVNKILLKEGTPLLAGINSDGLESHYQLMQSLLVTQAKVAALKSIFVSKNESVGIGSSYKLISNIFAAKVANSEDGAGAPFLGTDKSWPVVGEDQFDKAGKERRMHHAEIGFAITSPVLFLQEGNRDILVELECTDSSILFLRKLIEDIMLNQAGGAVAKEQRIGVMNAVFDRIFAGALNLSISGEESWMELPYFQIEPPEDWATNLLKLRINLPISAPPIVGFHDGLPGDIFATTWPVLKVVLNFDDSIYVYSFLKELRLEEIRITTQVQGLRSLNLYNDNGPLDSTAPFAPFGPAPHRNSYLLLGNVELFRKKLTDLEVTIEWNNLPDLPGGFSEYYADYPNPPQAEDFTVELSALSEFQFNPVKGEKQEFTLFSTLAPPQEGIDPITIFKDIDFRRLGIRPDYDMEELPEVSNKTQTGYFKWKMRNPSMVFGHESYPRLFAEAITENAKVPPFSILPKGEQEQVPIPREPYTPIIQRVLVNYEAATKLNFRQLSFRENDKKAREKLFHLHPFGMETVFQDGKASRLTLLPEYDEEGYLFIGIEGLLAPQPLSLFFEIEESKKIFNRTNLFLDWSYLRKNEWVLLREEEVHVDTTVSLATTGVVQLQIPEDISQDSTILPGGMSWIRVSASGNLDILGRAIKVANNAVEVIWKDNGDPQHYENLGNTPPITDLVKPIPQISSLEQVRPFFGGRPREKTSEFYIRVSERLRHKNRAVQLWDYERLVLEQFPEIHQVKCISSASFPSLRAGQIKVVIVPRITPKNPEPKAGYHLLDSVRSYLSGLASPFVDIEVINPVYERLRVSCALKLHDDLMQEQGKYLQQLNEELQLFICPWLQSGTLGFGGSISTHDVLGFLKERPYLEFVTRFSLVHVKQNEERYYSLEDTAEEEKPADIFSASLPWGVLVPTSLHQFIVVSDYSYIPPEIAAIESMRLGTDFVVLEDGNDTITQYQKERPQENGDEYFSLDDI